MKRIGIGHELSRKKETQAERIVKIILAVAVLFLAVPVTWGQPQKSVKRTYDGFSVAFPCAAEKDSKYPSYSCDSGKWLSSVDIDVNVPYETGSLTKEFMEHKFQHLFDSTMVPGTFTYSTLQGYPTVSAEVARKRNGQVILIGKVMYVFVKARRRIYSVSAFSFPSTLDATAAERKVFMESFEILD
jgi:hypothetical protein